MAVRKKKKPRTIIEKDGKHYTVRGVELTRANNTLTESEFWAKILSALRGITRFWPPKIIKLNEGRRPSQSSNKKLKWEYHCEGCNKWFPLSEIEMDHIINCGGIRCAKDVEGWVERAFVETSGYQRLCKATCHRQKTNSERGKK